MLTIGLVGGMSWESSLEYYRLLNTGIEDRLGGLHSAKVVLSSIEFAELTELQRRDDWDEAGALLAQAARGVQAAGADLVLMCTTSFHVVADQVEAAVDVPFVHLGDVVAEAAKAQGLTKVGLIGTAFTMSRSFFTDRIASHGVEVVVPEERHHETVNRIVYDELVHGKVLDKSRATVVELIDELWDAGAQGVILGCTELELLVKQADSDLPVFPCTTLHVQAVLDRALA
ncbi:aspartate/glutamate racemase family protein [Nocardioides iriomotensis]|uniref:Aspartate/glutamate racemase family protein n=1 Tax=Nocardioides iriomotensis TaxID=715784 RepID=A0A4Q5J4C9_9ACTN|nr:aspartate/glutamate racemase family protein [Nocardioides iriomotensis]RYU13364.1 aspartate/glutamate racemase family protein [Nocardioides iriomotensis]